MLLLELRQLGTWVGHYCSLFRGLFLETSPERANDGHASIIPEGSLEERLLTKCAL